MLLTDDPDTDLQAIKERCGRASLALTLLGQLRAVLISLRECQPSLYAAPAHAQELKPLSFFGVLLSRISKIWDTYTGACLHTFNHNHIVRTVALSPSTSANSSAGAYVLTGGQEKKLRIFDLARPEADPLYMTKRGDADGSEGLAHEGNIRSVIWDSQDGNVAVSAGEEGIVRWWDLRTLEQTAELKLPDAVTSMELAHGGGTLCVTSGKSVIFLDIARSVLLPLFSNQPIQPLLLAERLSSLSAEQARSPFVYSYSSLAYVCVASSVFERPVCCRFLFRSLGSSIRFGVWGRKGVLQRYVADLSFLSGARA